MSVGGYKSPARRAIAALFAAAASVSLLGCGGGSSPSNDAGSPETPVESGPTNDAGDSVTPLVSELSTWSLVWQDEFERDGLPDASKWDYDTYRNQVGWHNNELQYYSRQRLENSFVSDGTLKLVARSEQLTSASDWGGQNYTSTRLVTRGKAQWTYGYFEVRAKLPCTLGTWPAIWMLGDHTLPQEPNWPLDGEIDIMEQKGFNSTEKGVVSAALHFSDRHGGNPIFNDRSVPSACTGFNTYHLTWTTDAIKIGVNGVNYLTYNKPANPTQQNWPYDAPQYLLLNLAIGGSLGGTTIGNLPDQMEVDYVRVWQPPS